MSVKEQEFLLPLGSPHFVVLMDSMDSPLKAFLLRTSLTMGKWYDTLHFACMVSFNV